MAVERRFSHLLNMHYLQKSWKLLKELHAAESLYVNRSTMHACFCRSLRVVTPTIWFTFYCYLTSSATWEISLIFLMCKLFKTSVFTRLRKCFLNCAVFMWLSHRLNAVLLWKDYNNNIAHRNYSWFIEVLLSLAYSLCILVSEKIHY